MKRAGVEYRTMYQTRHTHATKLPANNVHPKLAQDRLGHSSVQTTLDVYSKVMPEDRDAVADTLDQSPRYRHVNPTERRESMQYWTVLAVVGLMALAGCEDPVEPREKDPYEVIVLRALPEGVEVSFGNERFSPLPHSRADLNENGQALWHEGEQAVLWDNGEILEVPVGRFLGPSGEVLGDSSVWISGELTEVPGFTRGITEDGVIYFSRDDTMFTWRDGVVEATMLPSAGTVGPEGQIYRTVYGEDSSGCQVFENGEWHRLPSRDSFCVFVMAEENGWVMLSGGSETPIGWIVGPNDSTYIPHWESYRPLVHINSRGEAITDRGHVFLSDTAFHAADVSGFERETLEGGAINDDGDILLRAGDRIVLLEKL